MSQLIDKLWAGGEHSFAFGLGELRALQKNCDAGPELVMTRLRIGSWMVDDIVEVLRIGLIGGGMVAKDASALVNRTFDQHGALALKLPAYEILSSALIRDPDDPVGEGEGVDQEPHAESGGSQGSTAQEP